MIDEIKKQTKITEQFITTAHTGRAKHAEGDERARGEQYATEPVHADMATHRLSARAPEAAGSRWRTTPTAASP